MTLFTETAQVASDYSMFSIDEFKYGVGAGLRYALNPSERFNIRLDVSWVDKGLGFVFFIKEAF